MRWLLWWSVLHSCKDSWKASEDGKLIHFYSLWFKTNFHPFDPIKSLQCVQCATVLQCTLNVLSGFNVCFCHFLTLTLQLCVNSSFIFPPLSSLSPTLLRRSVPTVKCTLRTWKSLKSVPVIEAVHEKGHQPPHHVTICVNTTSNWVRDEY